MENKNINLIIASIMLIGIMVSIGAVSSGTVYIGEIEPLSEIEIGDFIAGTTTTAEFEFEFTDNINAADHFPLIYEISFANSSEEIPEVWKEDFEIKNGSVAREIFGFEFREIDLECSDDFPLTINHQIGSETIESGENGTFYCYNVTEGTWDNLKKHNKVSLEIISNIALYPGEYNLTAKMFYLNDTYAPKIKLVNESYFDQYFTNGSNVDFEVEIEEPSLEEYQAKIIRNESDDISFYKEPVLDKTNIYHFFRTLPFINEGNYLIKIVAKDFNGNMDTAETTIKIDNTPPTIELLQPTEGVYSEILPIELNVTDEKSGVDYGSVEFRLREIVNGSICPETGASLGNYTCMNTGWINIDFNETTETFKEEVNTTELNLSSGEYWLDARAKDILGNEAYFEE